MKKNFLIIFMSLFCIFLTSCEQDVGIFASLEKEVKVIDENLDNTLTVPMMTIFGTDIYAKAGAFYRKTGTSWNTIALDSSNGSSGYNIITSLAASATDLYVILANSSSGESRVFSYNGTFVSVYAEAADEQLGSLFSIGANCYFSVKRNDGYHLYDADSGSATGAVFNAAPKQGALLISGTYYFIASNCLYTGASLAVVTLVPLATYKETDTILHSLNALYYDGTNLFVLSEDGDIFCFNGTTWLTKITVQSGSSGIALTCAASFTNVLNTILMVGTKSKGYYEVSYTTAALATIPEPHSPSATELTTDYSNFNASELKKESILSLIIDGSQNAYAGTAGSGVWLNAGLSDGIWNHE